ncbi:MAG: methyltransferase domain-containing protein [Clostridia bacterium]|nr:methyltransferase domain-containing protein [Clostridia bacterium]
MNAQELICPVCKAPLSLAENGKSLCCAGERTHNFDISRAGHVNLAGGGYSSASGDCAEMVRARIDFLERGHYSFLAEKLASYVSGVCVDAGCGNGYYSEHLTGAERVYAFDLSKSAVEYGAKKARREGRDALFAVSSVYSMPMADNSADSIISVFAPCAEAEFARVLKNGGRLIVAAAAPEHLKELKSVLYETVTENTERADLPRGFSLVEKTRISKTETLGADAIRSLYLMTPYSRKTSREAAERLFSLESLEITFSFDVFVYTKEQV